MTVNAYIQILTAYTNNANLPSKYVHDAELIQLQNGIGDALILMLAGIRDK